MQFTEKKAQEIIKKYSLAANTIVVWKHRNAIPDKYATDFTLSEKKEDRHVKRILEIIFSEKINARKFSKTAEVSYSKLQDVRRGKSFMTEDEFVKLKNLLNKIRVVAKKAASGSEKDLIDIIKEYEELKISTILGKKALDFRGGKRTIDTVKKEFTDRLSVFILETAL